jgi:cellulose synthase/poly-beta-1,6-N-acetylglucosamine synthase-like glycosyltransferase
MPTVPTCSVIVPTHARPRQLAGCLEALSRLDYPRGRLEVLVVDDDGGVALAPVVDAFRDRLDLTLLVQSRGGPAAARNAAAKRARGDLLAFTDDDCRPAPDWLRRLAERFAEEPDRAFGGLTVNALPGNPFATASQLVISVGYRQNNRDPDDARFFASNNLAFPREAFLALDGFDASFTTSEDRDLCARWTLSGRRMSYVPEAVVLHESDLTLAGFLRQFFSYGRGAFRYHQAQARRTARRVQIEPSFYWALVRRPFFDRSVQRPLLVAALLFVWHLANTAGFAWEWWNSRRAEPALVPERSTTK